MTKFSILTKVENATATYNTDNEIHFVVDLVGVVGENGKLGRINDFPVTVNLSDTKGFTIIEEGVVI